MAAQDARAAPRASSSRLPGPTETLPPELTDLLVAHLRGEPLDKVARLRTRRQSVRRDGAEIVEDAVSVFEGRRVVRRFREVEVELLDGDERSLRRLERVLQKAGAEPGELTPKLFHALELLAGGARPSSRADANPGDAFGFALAEQRRAARRPRSGDAARLRPGRPPSDARRRRAARGHSCARRRSSSTRSGQTASAPSSAGSDRGSGRRVTRTCSSSA